MNQDTLENKTVGEIVSDDFRTANIFKKYNIDFCCGGGEKLSVVCLQNNISIESIFNEINDVTNKPSNGDNQNYNQWELDFLADYIVNVHHTYVAENMPMLLEFTQKIGHVHGERHPELLKIADLFSDVANELQGHMMKEEQILFPYIKKMVAVSKQDSVLEPSPFGTVRNPISMMEMEHESAGGILNEIRQISKNFQLPNDACETYKVTYKKLDEFELGLHKHIHLENNILFPKAVALEEKLLS
jgi:regulator of cell morphogenesis and NO signaling